MTYVFNELKVTPAFTQKKNIVNSRMFQRATNVRVCSHTSIYQTSCLSFKLNSRRDLEVKPLFEISHAPHVIDFDC